MSGFVVRGGDQRTRSFIRQCLTDHQAEYEQLVEELYGLMLHGCQPAEVRRLATLRVRHDLAGRTEKESQ